MKAGYLDCFSGISGDMLLGAFLDAGWEQRRLLELPERLGLDAKIEIKKVAREGISATKVDVSPKEAIQPSRRLEAILELISGSDLPERLKERVCLAFERLACAEAHVHGVGVDDVHFHETGAVDAIIDIVGSFMAREDMGIERLFCSPLPLSRGFVRCQHGTLPLPAPAVLELLKGVETFFVNEDRELVTPTGALLAVTLADEWGSPKELVIDKVGYGAGSHILSSRPNLLRLIAGFCPGDEKETLGEVVELKTVVDDMAPELIGFLMERLFDAGAVDVWLTPVFMKKNRPGTEITVISNLRDHQRLAEIIFVNSTTSGIRIRRVKRIVLERYKVKVKTRWGVVEAKAIRRPDGREEIVPEYEVCKELAKRFGMPIGEVYRAVLCGEKDG